ncbi:hypothetical protein [Terrimonas ferruginea]|nr:hypothetical protein [Terrimonas ferruginea]
MNKFITCLAAMVLLTFVLSSCAATKRDCQGVKHTRLKNGIYL